MTNGNHHAEEIKVALPATKDSPPARAKVASRTETQQEALEREVCKERKG